MKVVREKEISLLTPSNHTNHFIKFLPLLKTVKHIGKEKYFKNMTKIQSINLYIVLERCYKENDKTK
jgi:hypothetical protein